MPFRPVPRGLCFNEHCREPGLFLTNGEGSGEEEVPTEVDFSELPESVVKIDMAQNKLTKWPLFSRKGWLERGVSRVGYRSEFYGSSERGETPFSKLPTPPARLIDLSFNEISEKSPCWHMPRGKLIMVGNPFVSKRLLPKGDLQLHRTRHSTSMDMNDLSAEGYYAHSALPRSSKAFPTGEAERAQEEGGTSKEEAKNQTGKTASDEERSGTNPHTVACFQNENRPLESSAVSVVGIRVCSNSERTGQCVVNAASAYTSPLSYSASQFLRRWTSSSALGEEAGSSPFYAGMDGLGGSLHGPFIGKRTPQRMQEEKSMSVEEGETEAELGTSSSLWGSLFWMLASVFLCLVACFVPF